MTRNRLSGMFAPTLLLAVLGAAAPADAVPVTFQVRMAHQAELGNFTPGPDAVDVAGTFNGWGTSPLTPLADADGDTVYAVTVEGFAAGQVIEFKFRINGLWDGSEEFPGGGPNRVHTVGSVADSILVWYGDVSPVPPAPPALDELAWWNDTVFYEIFVRSFQDGDGDGIGDLAGLTDRLDYLNDGNPATTDDLGITGIWLMPVNASPSYHGYDAADYRAIEPDYGTLSDFTTFLAAARARGIRVITDYVMNHCSTQHPWFAAAAAGDPAYRDWFRWSPTDPGQLGPWGQQVWHWHASGWYYGLFWGGMPDLDYATPAVKDEMFATANWWLDTVGVDGFRLDAVLYIHEDGDRLQDTPATFGFWQDFGAHVRGVKADALTVGEAWTGSSTVVNYVTDGRLDFCFEFEQASAILGAVDGADAGWLAAKAQQVYALYPYLQYGTFLTNHDQDRVMSVLGGDEGKSRVAAGLALTLPGVPFLYYGEEIGMAGAGAHENIRTPMQWTAGPQAGFTTGAPWQPVNADYTVRNVAGQAADPGSLLSWYRRLIAVRQAAPALRRGELLPVQSSASPVLAFLRRHGGQTLLCVANTLGQPLGGLTLTGPAAGPAPGTYRLANLLDAADARTVTVGADHAISGFSVPAHTVAVYEFAGASAVDGGEGAPPPAGLVLHPAYPNPFNPVTTIRFTLPAAGTVRVAVYDLAGREVAVLAEEVRAAGRHEVRWDGRDTAGRAAAAGAYVVRVTAGGQARLGKLTLVK